MEHEGRKDRLYFIIESQLLYVHISKAWIEYSKSFPKGFNGHIVKKESQERMMVAGKCWQNQQSGS